MNRSLALSALLTVVFTAPAFAQMAAPACEGDVAVVRVSQVKPTSTLATFLKAQEAHIAWYRKNGFTDNQIYAARIVVTDPATKAMKYSDTEVMSFHVRPPVASSGANVSSKDQAGWDAYLKQYRDSSDIREEYFVCLPKSR